MLPRAKVMSRKSDNLPALAAKYLTDALGIISSPLPWPKAKQLPYYLQGTYRFYTMEIANTNCLLMCAIEPETPGAIAKQLKKLGAEFKGLVIYVADQVSSHNRKRLIEQRVPFIVPSTQLYLPMLGILLSEHFASDKTATKQFLSAPAQLLLIHYLLGDYTEPLSSVSLAAQFAYSKMTTTRACKELLGLNLAEIKPLGREKLLVFVQPPQTLWLQALPYLQSPVQKQIRSGSRKFGLLAGESALAQRTLLAKPANVIKAIAPDDWETLKHIVMPSAADDEVLELWRYNPTLLSDDDSVDNFSLYLSLKDHTDERIEQALESLLQKTWEQQSRK
jgi:hypothetical protein